MRKVCLVIPSLHPGGMERVMSELASYLCKKHDLEIYLILYGINREIFYKIPDNLIVKKPEFKFDNSRRFFHTLKTMVFLRKTISRIAPCSILSFGEYWNSFVLLSLYNYSCTVFISDRCSPVKKFSRFHTFLRRWLYPRVQGIIAQTDKAKNLYHEQFNHNNITVIGNPIHFVRGIGIAKGKIVLTVGRLINSKNHDKLIELFCNINQEGWKLVIVGGDSLKQKNMSRLKNLIRDLNADSKVIITGFIKDPEKYYLESSIFVFTSESEGFPNVIGEAMSASMPVIAFDCVAGPSEMIKDGENGYLVPLHDYCLFRERLGRLMTDEPLRKSMGSKANDSIQKFSIDNIGAKYYDFIIPK